MATYDQVIIVGNFNIHVLTSGKGLFKPHQPCLCCACCGWSHSGTQTQHLIWFYFFSLPVLNLDICGSVFSDQMLILFEVTLTVITVKPHTAAWLC